MKAILQKNVYHDGELEEYQRIARAIVLLNKELVTREDKIRFIKTMEKQLPIKFEDINEERIRFNAQVLKVIKIFVPEFQVTTKSKRVNGKVVTVTTLHY